MTSSQIKKWFKDHSDFPAVVFHDAVAFPPMVYDLASEKRYNEFIRAISSFGPKIEVKTMTYAGVEREVLKFDAESSKCFIEDSDTDTPRFDDAGDIRDLFKGDKKPYRELTEDEKKEAARLGRKVIPLDDPVSLLEELSEIEDELEEKFHPEPEDDDDDDEEDDLDDDESEDEEDSEEEEEEEDDDDDEEDKPAHMAKGTLEEIIYHDICDAVHPSSKAEKDVVAKVTQKILRDILRI